MKRELYSWAAYNWNNTFFHLMMMCAHYTVVLPPTKEEVNVYAGVWRLFVCLFVCLFVRLLKNACMDLDEMFCVDRCGEMDELINFWAWFGL